MKLKCDPHELKESVAAYCKPSGGWAAEIHDAAFAHALLKALEHVHEPMRGMVLKVAAEILRDEFGVMP